jgi:RNA polymerase sigma factor (TIGR02999 family)
MRANLPDLLDITQWLNDLSPQEAARAEHLSADVATKIATEAASEVASDLFVWLYAELHRVARNHMYRENADHTLSATALTHEAWFLMSVQTRTQWQSRSHFLAVASTAMRRILVKHALAKRADKRHAVRVSMTAAEHLPANPLGNDVVAIHEALEAFERIDLRAAQVVELKFFGGMENLEVAEALGISLATVKRDWGLARAWLLRELSNAA